MPAAAEVVATERAEWIDVPVETGLATDAERGVMKAVEGDCKTPVAAFAQRDGDQMFLRALLAESDGSRLRRDEVRVRWPDTPEEARDHGLKLGRRLKSA